jgi:uncharacterized protein (TIGR02996 family)
MNEDVAFLAAVVANPAADTTRLVYADWLDERDDQRGAYLRAEVAWAKSRGSGDESRIRQMGQSLDAVWCARLSRPPVGVCCEHVHFSPNPKAKPVTSDDLDQLEKRFGITLPTDYRAFLLNYNGGKPSPNRLYIPARMDSTDVADWVISLHSVCSAVDAPRLQQWVAPNRSTDVVVCMQCLEWFRSPAALGDAICRYMAEYWQNEPHCNLLWIGYGDRNMRNDVHCLGVRGKQFGKVFYAAGDVLNMCEDGNCIPVADSFAEFLSLLTELRSSMKPRRKPKS